MPFAAKDLFSGDEPAAIAIEPVSETGLSAMLDSLEPVERRWAQARDFRAAKGELVTLPKPDGSLSRVLFGLGPDAAQSPDIWAYAALPAQLPPGRYRLPDVEGPALEHAALGWGLAQYVFDRYRRQTAEARVLSIPGADDRAAFSAALDSLFLVRDLVNVPANHMGPEDLAQAAADLADRFGADYADIVDDQLLEENFPAIYTVGQASSRRPRLIELNWGEEDRPLVCLVGKGVCFDSGGLDLKNAAGMRLMKKDMGGAAHALGLAHWVMATGLPVRLKVLVAAVENAVAGNAFRPGDILATRKGVTVEVGNTDAEGRLILADALSYACESSPNLLIDFATLTGAARVALGGDLPALFTDDHALAGQLAAVAAEEGDPLWRLPLYGPYEEDLMSPVADLANIGEGGFAGAILAGLFLRRFVSPDVRWAHFDLYAWNQRNRPGRPQGGEAMALRTVFATLKRLYGQAEAAA